MPSLAGSQLDKYDMLEEVGHGGMAVVYRGRDRVLEREVAVKVLHPHLSDREESRLRLQREAIAVAKLRHENILEIFDYSGPKAAESYIVTEFIHGPTLREWIDDSLEPRPAVAAMIIHRLCVALCQAHRGGIVHRDIKPENVMIRTVDGCIKLMDFGIAQILDDQKLTLTGQLIGSPAYMAPELISGRPLDARTDLFSLGILVYQLATGALPFSGRNPHEVLNRIADGDFVPPSSVCPLVDRELEAIITRALATDPDERYQSADSLAKELETYLAEVGLAPTPEELGDYFRSPVRYVEELDLRVGRALMERAEAAAGDGQTSRAIRLLGRVLELDGQHRAAKALLLRLQTRERRVRRLAWCGGVAGLFGMVAAGAMLIPSQAPQALARLENRPGAANMHVMPPAPATPPPAADKPRTIPLESTDPAQASTGATPSPPPTEVEAAPRAKPRKPPERVAAVPLRCRVRFENLPESTARGKTVQVGSELLTLGGSRVSFELAGPSARVNLKDKAWRGHRDVTRTDCEAGEVVIAAHPEPATVNLPGAPSNAALICISGCAKRDIGRSLAPSLLRIPIPDNSNSVRVKMIVKAEGYNDLRIDEALFPGPNSIAADMDPK